MIQLDPLSGGEKLPHQPHTITVLPEEGVQVKDLPLLQVDADKSPVEIFDVYGDKNDFRLEHLRCFSPVDHPVIEILLEFGQEEAVEEKQFLIARSESPRQEIDVEVDDLQLSKIYLKMLIEFKKKPHLRATDFERCCSHEDKGP